MNTTFGEQFLETLQAELGSSLFDYATTQRVKRMDREELLAVLRTNAGATYAEIQQLRKAEDPRELAMHLVAAQRRSGQTLATATFLGLLFTMS